MFYECKDLFSGLTVWPDLVTITSGFTDFSTLTFLGIGTTQYRTLNFRLDVTGMGRKGLLPDYATPWYDSLDLTQVMT